MALQLFPEPSSSSINADSYTVPTASKQYKVVKNFDAAVYTITTSPNTSEATVQFDTGSSFAETTTISGTVTYNLASSATNAILITSTGSDVVVTITKVAAALSGAEMSGTLDTITSTGTYNQTGKLYVVAVGGGGGGGADFSPHSAGGGGGGGALKHGIFYVNTSTSITIGSAGNGGTSPYIPGNSGGTTNFGNLLSAGGGNSAAPANNEQGNTPGYGQTGGGNYGSPGNGNIVPNPRLTVAPGTNGGGGGGAGGGNYRSAGAGAGSGIGTGGAGNNYGAGNGGNANGYGAGGGGAGAQGGNINTQKNGGAGSPGVIYVLRGF